MARTGLAYSARMLDHDTGVGHPERSQRLAAIKEAFDGAGLAPPEVNIVPATRDDILRIHTADHVEKIQQTCALGQRYSDPDTTMCHESWEAALLAAGACISACKAVLDGELDNAFCAVRPPGHHAEADHAQGFCIFNNAAIAARWLQQVAGVGRVAIFDWDVHHGNGSQHSFYDDPTVYYLSMHQHPFYPGTGWPHERGAENTNLNVQMPPGSDHDDWLEAFREKIAPELERFNPEFLIVSAGFDAHRLDPIGSQRCETETFAELTRGIKSFAGGRIVSVLEGGYHLEALGECSLAHFQALAEA